MTEIPREPMNTITAGVFRAKDDLDTAMGELQRLGLLLEIHLNSSDILVSEYDQIAWSLSIVTSKVRNVRASL